MGDINARVFRAQSLSSYESDRICRILLAASDGEMKGTKDDAKKRMRRAFRSSPEDNYVVVLTESVKEDKPNDVGAGFFACINLPTHEEFRVEVSIIPAYQNAVITNQILSHIEDFAQNASNRRQEDIIIDAVYRPKNKQLIESLRKVGFSLAHPSWNKGRPKAYSLTVLRKEITFKRGKKVE